MILKYVVKKGRQEGATEEMTPGVFAARCASLLRGGVAPGRVCEVIAEETPTGSLARQISMVVSSGETPGHAIAMCVASHDDSADWKLLAAAWQLAEQTGAPLAAALDRLAEALQSLQRLRERRGVLLAAPRATTRMVATLPPLVLLLGWLLGFDLTPVLLSWGGLGMLSLGFVLLAAGVTWARRLTDHLQAEDRVAGIECELVWVALGGGSPPFEAIRRVVDCVDRIGVPWVSYDRFCGDATLMKAVKRAADVGMPLGPLLLAEAGSLRASAHAELESAAERLGVRVLVPLGVCVLPSFIVMGVLPVVISMLAGSSL